MRLKVENVDFQIMRKANAIAQAYRTAMYAALHVALAEQAGYPRITADEFMVEKLVVVLWCH